MQGGQHVDKLPRMPGNPKRSKWRVTPQDARNRKMVAITLSDEARERLERLADEHGLTKSMLVEALIMAAPIPPRG